MIVTNAPPTVIHGLHFPRAYRKIIKPKVIKRNPTSVKKEAYRTRANTVTRALPHFKPMNEADSV